VDKEFNVGVEARNLEQRMALDLLTDSTVQLITLVGKAGTGKTFLTLAAALSQLHTQYEQIILAKPIIDMGNSIGFLPGDLDEKLQPWMASYYDNLSKIMPTKSFVGTGKKKEPNWKYLLDTEAVVVQPLNSIRGRSLDNSFIVIDEAQNLTTHEIKTIVTRAGENTKVVLLGDPYQVDSPFLDKHSNGLTYVSQRMLGESIFGTVFFTQGVRSELAEVAANRL
jgi:PhoH-like ATPase